MFPSVASDLHESSTMHNTVSGTESEPPSLTHLWLALQSAFWRGRDEEKRCARRRAGVWGVGGDSAVFWVRRNLIRSAASGSA